MDSTRSPSGRGDKSLVSHALASFSNLDEAMSLAIERSLSEGDQGLLTSFRNLHGVIEEAKRNSMSSSEPHSRDRRVSFLQGFSDLDEATSLAIQNSLNNNDKELFNSFRNLEGVIEEEMQNSMSSSKSHSKDRRVSLLQSFSELDEATALAIQNSLNNNDNEVFKSFRKLEGLVEEGQDTIDTQIFSGSESSPNGGGDSSERLVAGPVKGSAVTPPPHPERRRTAGTETGVRGALLKTLQVKGERGSLTKASHRGSMDSLGLDALEIPPTQPEMRRSKKNTRKFFQRSTAK